ncbi:hypothetical protein [Egbenema bharatensis]|uniref:hypothetical protein n=1 Tax=Egbenema bharatensis TaxID=3463334 RepID=UPI003A8A60C1
MNPTFLPPDDLPPTQLTALDEKLRQQLEESIAKRFYEACDGVTQSLLCQCKWQITTQAVALTLRIDCVNAAAHWRVLHNLVPLANQLARFSLSAKIHISPPPEIGVPFELQVSEIAFCE